MIRSLILVTALMLMSGCTTKLCKSGASTDDFNNDHYECAQRARQMAQFGDVYNPFEDVSQQRACLARKGWSRCSE